VQLHFNLKFGVIFNGSKYVVEIREIGKDVTSKRVDSHALCAPRCIRVQFNTNFIVHGGQQRIKLANINEQD